MSYLARQFFIWGLTCNFCTAVFIALVSIFDDNLQSVGVQMGLYFTFLWPFSSFVGIALRSHILNRSGEWLALQCMGWSGSRVLLSAVISGLSLGLLPLLFSFLGWKNLLDLSTQQLNWVWSNGAAVQVKSGLSINLNGVQMVTPKVGLDFAPVWLSLNECIQGNECGFELQRRSVRCLTSVLVAPLAVVSILYKNNRLFLCCLGLLMALLSCLPNQTGTLLWGPIFILSLSLYALGSRM